MGRGSSNEFIRIILEYLEALKNEEMKGQRVDSKRNPLMATGLGATAGKFREAERLSGRSSKLLGPLQRAERNC